MKKEDLAYVAGLFDGEGCIFISKISQKGKPSPTHTLHLVVVNTDRDIIKWLKKNFKGSIYKEKIRSENHSQCWRWDIYSRQAKKFLDSIYPYLKIKSNQADIALRFIETIDEHTGASKISEEVLALRDEYANGIKALNSRRSYG